MPNASSLSTPFWRRTQVILLIGVCLASDFFMGPVLAAQKVGRHTAGLAIFFTVLGCALAQGSLLAAWLALGDWPFGLRLRRHWFMAAILFLVWSAGFVIGDIPQFSQNISFVAFSVPLVSMAAQLPFWIFRQLFGWRLMTSQLQANDRPTQHTIRDLLGATAIVAISLALARAAPSPDDKEIGALWIAMLGVASSFSAIAMLPAVAILMRPGSFRRRVWLALLYAGVWVGLLWLIVLVVLQLGRTVPPPAAAVVGASCLILSYAVTVILAASVARSYGYWLAWGRHSAG
jgi:hypothetical protein